MLDNFSAGTRVNLPVATRYARAGDRRGLRDLPAVEGAAAGAKVIFNQAAMRSVPAR